MGYVKTDPIPACREGKRLSLLPLSLLGTGFIFVFILSLLYDVYVPNVSIKNELN